MRFFFLTLFLSFSVLAQREQESVIQTKPLLWVREIKASRSLPDQTLVDQLNKAQLRMASTRREFELWISSESSLNGESKTEVFFIENQIQRKQNGKYNLRLKLRNLKTKKVISNARISNVSESDLLRLYERAVKALFTPDLLKEINQEEESKKKRESPKKDTAVLNQLSPEQNRNNIDFKNRIAGLQIAVDKKIKKAKDVKDSSSKDKSSNKKKQNISPSNQSRPFAQSVAQAKSKKPSISSTIPRNYKIHSLFKNSQSAVQTNLLVTKQNFSFLEVGFETQLYRPKALPVELGFAIEYNRIVSSEYEVDSPMNLELSLGSRTTSRLSGKVSYSKEQTVLVTLPAPGDDLQGFLLDTDHIGFHLSRQNGSGSWKNTLSLSYSQIINGASSLSLLEGSSYSGSKFEGLITFDSIAKNLSVGIIYRSKEITTQGSAQLSLSETSYGPILSYQF